MLGQKLQEGVRWGFLQAANERREKRKKGVSPLHHSIICKGIVSIGRDNQVIMQLDIQ